MEPKYGFSPFKTVVRTAMVKTTDKVEGVATQTYDYSERLPQQSYRYVCEVTV